VIELIGVPFDGFGRVGHQSSAAEVLRAAGLAHAFDAEGVLGDADLRLPPPNPGRAPGSGLMNEAALMALTGALAARVASAITAGRFPIVYGGDCSLLLGAMCGLRDAVSAPGLLFVDGHQDTTPLDVSRDGEAANMEVGLLLGLTGQLAPPALRARLPVLDADALAVLGPRDRELRRELNLASLADLGVHFRDHAAVAADPQQLRQTP
jgi:arginase